MAATALPVPFADKMWPRSHPSWGAGGAGVAFALRPVRGRGSTRRGNEAVVRASELRQTAPFEALPARELAAVAVLARAREFRRGERLFRAGEPCQVVGIVLAGLVRLTRPLPGGDRVTVGLVRPGGLLSAVPLQGRPRHDNDAEALGPGRGAEFPTEPFLALARRSPALLVPLLRCLLARVDDAYDDAAASATVESRLLWVLRRASRGDRAALPGEPRPLARLAVPLSHADLAKLVNADRATVTRSLRPLEEQGLIRRERGHVIGVAPAWPGS